MIVIGLAGRAGSGKDTVGASLRDNYGFALVSFAHPIKNMITELLSDSGLLADWNDREWRETELEALGNKSPRYLAQTLGTEWGRRQIDQDVWVNLALAKIERFNSDYENAAITDVRFDNEAHRIRERGYIIHIHRPGDEGGTKQVDHSSEAGIRVMHGDFHINNYGTLAQLHEQVGAVVDRILELEKEKALEEIQGDAANPAGVDD